MSDKLLLIDGHSIINRAFYGLPDLTNAEGLHTGAVYGFLNILLRFIDEEKPAALAVAFDVHAPTFRHEMYAEYKGKRKPMPEELRSQVPLLKEVLDDMGVYRMEQAGLEADDLLGTAARRAQAAGWDATIVSGDRDLLQVATDRIIIAQPKTVRGQTTVTRYDAAAVEAEWGVSGERFIDLKALMGDASDNIPGLPKVGEKTAKELMAQFGSGEAIFAGAASITKKALRETVENHRADYDLSRRLATIDQDAPFDFPLDAARLPENGVNGYFTAKAYETYKRLGFKNLLNRFDLTAEAGAPAKAAQAVPDMPLQICAGRKDADRAFEQAAHGTAGFTGVCLLWDRDRGDADGQLSFISNGAVRIDGRKLTGAAVYAAGHVFCYVPVTAEVTAEYLGGALERLSQAVRIALFDAGDAYHFFTPARILNDEENKAEQVFDCRIAAYLLNPLVNEMTPEDLAGTLLGEIHASRAEIFGKADFADAADKAPAYAGDCARICALTAPILAEQLAETGMLDLFERIEMPLSYILYDMERIGIGVRRDELKAYGEQLTGRIAELEQSIYEAAGSVFNINSPRQLGEILFDRMGLPGGKKTKTGYSTAADVLEKIAEDAPIVRDILEYRGLTKLKSTYADGLADYIAADGRIHTTYHQTVTATGRISSSDPNLQNIPMRTELGRAIRRVFVPAKGCIFADADYSQIELRILAAMSGDGELIEAYRQGSDIHAITASKVFGVPMEEVTPLMRRNAKAVNFGIVYGISSFCLSQNIDISRQEAAAYIKQYFATYPGIKTFLDRQVALAKERGYAETLYHRRRPVPELKSSNFVQRGFGERVAMNAPIQGTAADIMKIAMIRVWKRLREEGRKAQLILQIHDELLIEAPEEEKDVVVRILTEEMCAAADLAVPLEADCHTGTDWYEAK